MGKSRSMGTPDNRTEPPCQRVTILTKNCVLLNFPWRRENFLHMKKRLIIPLILLHLSLHLQSAEKPLPSPQTGPLPAESGEQLFLKGKSCEEEGDYDRAVKLYNEASDKGNTKAMVNLGFCYEGGGGVVIDQKRAYDMFSRAASLGDPKGMAKKGVMLCEGKGCAQDTVEGVALLEKSALLNEPNALRVMVIACMMGRYGVPRDKARGISYLKQGAAIEDPFCCDVLGHCYLRGDGVPVDTKLGNQLLSKSVH